MVSTIRIGLSNLRTRRRLWGGLYLAKLTLALIFMLPVMVLVSAKLDYSRYAAPLLGSWSIDVILELIQTSDDLLPAIIAVLLFYTIAVFFVGQFLNGGVYDSFLSREPIGPVRFAAQSTAQFRGNLKISLVMGVLYIPLFLLAILTGAFIPRDTLGHFGDAAFGGLFSRLAVIYVFMITGSIFSELLRIHHALHPADLIIKGIRPVFNFYITNLVKLTGVYYLYFLPFAVIWLLVEKLAIIVTGGLTGLLGVMLELFLFQLCSLLRTGQSLAFTATVAPLARKAFPGRFEDEPTEQTDD